MRGSLPGKFALASLLAGVLACGPVFADKPEGVGVGKGGKGSQEWKRGDARAGEDRRDDRRGYQGRDHQGRDDWSERRARYFEDRHRAAIHEYFDRSFRSGRCPPGLAKKHNGCMPPGHAKAWIIGRPLPRGVIFYDLPSGVLLHLGYPPPGYRFVRVASDILLIAIGTGMVVDAIEDLGRY